MRNEENKEPDDEEFLLACDLCGVEDDEEEVDQTWIVLANRATCFEVLVCPDCASTEEDMQEAFKIFLGELAALKREEMT